MKLLAELDKIQALVVGATQGIGLGFVRAFLKEERFRQVFATYRDGSDLQDLLLLQQQHPERLTLLPMNVCDESEIQSALQQIQKSAGEIHLALYCVGVLHAGEIVPEKSLLQLKAEHLLTSFQVNSVGAVLLAKHLLPLFPRDKPGILASISAKVGSIADNRLGGWYGYRASKAALNMLMRTSAIEYARRCPRTIVVTLHPGTTDTRLSKPFQKNVPQEQLFSVDQTVSLLCGVLGKLELKDSGEFFSWNGSRLPW